MTRDSTNNRFGFWVSLAVPVAIATTSLVLGRAVVSEPNSTRLSAADGIAAMLFIFAVLLLGLVSSQIPGSIHVARTRRINAGRVVFQSVRVPALRDTFRDVGRAERTSVPEPPHWFSIVVDSEGLEIWGGIVSPARLMRFPTSVIEQLTIGSIGPSVRGLIVHVRAGESVIPIPLPVVGAGPLGMFSSPSASVERELRTSGLRPLSGSTDSTNLTTPTS